MKKFNVMFAIFCLATSISCEQNFDTDYKPEPQPVQHHEHYVTIEQAEASLNEILIDMTASATRAGELFAPRTICNRHSRNSIEASTRSNEDDSVPLFHIFNFANNAGFAIMSTDDRLPSLLALIEEGNFNEGDAVTNPGLAIAMDGMENLYLELKKEEILDPPTTGIERYTITTFADMLYTLKVNWHQSAPYNASCPLSNGKHTLVGCVAVAVGQLMSMYEYPSSYNGFWYDWADIIHEENDNDDDPSAFLFMLGLPQNLDMDYGLNSSGADPDNIPRTFRNFGYSSCPARIDYSTTKIVEELSAGYPCLIRGNAKKIIGNIYKEGHCWLAHGLMTRQHVVETHYYDGAEHVIKKDITNDYYIRCNVGWEDYGTASGDGYYLSGVFDIVRSGPNFPDNTEDAMANTNSIADTRSEADGYFQYNKEMFIGIRK